MRSVASFSTAESILHFLHVGFIPTRNKFLKNIFFSFFPLKAVLDRIFGLDQRLLHIYIYIYFFFAGTTHFFLHSHYGNLKFPDQISTQFIFICVFATCKKIHFQCSCDTMHNLYNMYEEKKRQFPRS